MMLPNSFWGDDLLLEAGSWLANRSHQRFFTLTFTQLSCLACKDLQECLAQHPAAAAEVRHSAALLCTLPSQRATRAHLQTDGAFSFAHALCAGAQGDAAVHAATRA